MFATIWNSQVPIFQTGCRVELTDVQVFWPGQKTRVGVILDIPTWFIDTPP
jgi:hypothetical protein